MEQIKRIVKIAIPRIQESMKSKLAFDSLAFCLLAKLNLQSSTIHNATYRNLKTMTRLGNQKLKSIIDYCTKHSMIVLDKATRTMHILKLYNEEYYVYVYKFKNKYRKRKHKQAIRFNLTLARVKDMLREAVMCAHLKRIDNIRQQVLLTQNPKTVKEYRKGRNLARELGVWGNDFFISNNRLAHVAKCSISKIRAIKARLISHNAIQVSYANKIVASGNNSFNYGLYSKYDCGYGFFFIDSSGNLIHREPNVYKYRGKNLKYVLTFNN